MDSKAATMLATAAAVLLASAAFFAFRYPAAIGAGASAATSTAAVRKPPEPASSARPPRLTRRAPSVASAPTAGDALLLDESALMDALRELRGSDPSFTLQLAREGNERFKDSAGAAERSWFIVKALSDLGRHDEARFEGRVLVDEHTETRWAQDVYRHLFVNPSTHPFERGYGKTLESDP